MLLVAEVDEVGTPARVWDTDESTWYIHDIHTWYMRYIHDIKIIIIDVDVDDVVPCET